MARTIDVGVVVGAPVVVDGRLWGVASASWHGDRSPAGDTEDRLARFAQLLDSAIANAKVKDQSVDLDDLYIKTIHADKAGDRHMRRWRPRAHGRATRVAKGLSHITIILDSRKEA